MMSYSYCFIFQHFQTLNCVCLACLLAPVYHSKTKAAGLETTSFSEHNTQSFLHPLLGQTAHLHHVSLAGLVYFFPLSPLTLQTDDLMQIEIASLGSWVV